AWVRERAVGIQLYADGMNPRVDLHGVDVLGAQPQRDRDIIAGAGADDKDVVGRGPSAGVGETVDGHHVELSAGRLDGLVRDPVHQQPDGARRLRRQPDLVIRRPAIGGNRRLQAEDDQHGSQYRRLPERAAPIDEQEQREDDDRSPYNRWGFQESEQGEGDDSGQAPEDVEAVRLEGRKLSEGARHTLTHQRHHAGYAQEQKWKGDE